MKKYGALIGNTYTNGFVMVMAKNVEDAKRQLQEKGTIVGKIKVRGNGIDPTWEDVRERFEW